MNSSRYQGKVMKIINGKPLLHFLIKQLRASEKIDNIVIATTTSNKDDIIEKFAKTNSIDCFRGDEFDVLDRFYKCAKRFQMDNIVRITGDNPLIDPKIIDQCIKEFSKKDVDYLSNGIKFEDSKWVHNLNGFPSGVSCEVFSFKTLEKIFFNAKKNSEREHVTSFIINNHNNFQITNISSNIDYSSFRFTVDYEEDFRVIKKILKVFQENEFISIQEIISFLNNNKDILKINSEFLFNEGYLESVRDED